MTKKVYRSAQGKMIDLGSLQLQNETVRAVGNMGVNARGDIVDSRNNSIDSRNRQVHRQYNRQVAPVSDQPVSTRRGRVAEPAQADPVIATIPDELFDTELPTAEPVAQEETTVTTESGGLAAAIAKARQIKQEPLKTPKQASREAPGVRKL